MNILGIDVGGTKTLGILSDEHGNVLAEITRPTPASEGVEAVLSLIVAVIRDLTPDEGVAAVGVGIPGPVDPALGQVYEPANLPGWQIVPLRRMIQEKLADLHDSRLALPQIALVNDANAATLAEYRFGAGSRKRLGRKIKHMVYLTISTGIGGGVITDGRLLLGANGYAAELGHIVVEAFGRRCSCGSIGCLESVASGTALARDAAMVVRSRRPSKISDLAGGDPANVSARIVEEAARLGDPIACELWEREGRYVGVGVVNCIHAFNPEIVVLGGGVTMAGDLLFKPVLETVRQRVLPAFAETYDIVPAALKGESGALGAVAVALELLEKHGHSGR